MWIPVRLIIKRPSVRRGANVELAVRTLVGAIPLALVCRPIRHPGGASLRPTSQRPDSHTCSSIKGIFLIVIVAILLDRRITTSYVQLPRVIVAIPPGVNWFQRLVRR